MRNIIIFILLTTFAQAQFSTGTTQQIDKIDNNTQTDIILNPVNTVKVNNFTGGFVLESGASKELQESATSSVELGYLSGVTSDIQTQINGKEPTLPITTDGDLLYYNSGRAALGIGTNGQILRVSALGFPEWADVISVSVTTKGDIQTYSTLPDRLAVGTDAQILSADSAETTGLKWIDLPISSPITTEGDLAIGDNAGDPVRLPIGTVDQLLTSDGTTASWQDAPISTTLTTKGDIQVFDTANARLPVGTDGQFIVADSTEATGLKYTDTLQGSLNPVGNWIDGTCGSTWVTNATVTCKYRRVGDSVDIQWHIDLTGAPTSATLFIDTPSEIPVVDSAKLVEFSNVNQSNIHSSATYRDEGLTVSSGGVRYFTNNSFRAVYNTSSGTVGSVNQVNPFTWGNTDGLTINASGIPITGWSSGVDAVSQFKTLDATSMNSLSLQWNTSSETISSQSVQWATATPLAGTGTITITFDSGVFTERPNCVCTVDSTAERDCMITNGSASSIDIHVRQTGGTSINDNGYLICNKQEADTNKEIVIAAPIDSQKWKCQKNTLSAQVTSTGFISDWAFSNLTIGKKYQLFGKLTWVELTAGNNSKSGILRFISGSALSHNVFSTQSTATLYRDSVFPKFQFIADATSISVEATVMDDIKIAAGGFNDSSMTLCELPDNYDLNYTGF